MTAPLPVRQWAKLARIVRAAGWVVIAAGFTGITAAELVREIVAGPALSLERTRRRLAVELAAVPPPAGPKVRDCLRMTAGAQLCRQPVGHAGPCDPSRSA